MSQQSGRVPVWRSLQTKFALTYIVIIAAVLVIILNYVFSKLFVFRSGGKRSDEIEKSRANAKSQK